MSEFSVLFSKVRCAPVQNFKVICLKLSKLQNIVSEKVSTLLDRLLPILCFLWFVNHLEKLHFLLLPGIMEVKKKIEDIVVICDVQGF